MYSFLKRIAKSVIPKSLLRKNEHILRTLVALPYRGTAQQCNICTIKLRKFITLPCGDHLCPSCGSRSRSRRLYKYLLDHHLLRGKILHFSPPKCLYSRIKASNLEHYYATDFENEFVADYQFDITKIDLPDDTVDLIICYHVLEHIENDLQAMKELYRVLDPKGVALLQTPFKDGDIYEDWSITSQDARERAFGQKDHVRIYSRDGLANRLKKAGFNVNIERFAEDKISYYGLRSETMMVASI